MGALPKRLSDAHLQMYDDLASGMAKVKIKQRYENGGYGTGCDDFERDYRVVIRCYAMNIENIADDERAKLYGRYQEIYRLALERGRIKDAREILDAMVKLSGVNKDGGIEVGDGTITISFGTKNN